VTDTVLVRAPVGVVYRTLTDLDGWPRWLDGCRTSRPSGADGERHRLVLPVGRRRFRAVVTVSGWRHDLGVHWDVEGPVAIRSEWWLERRPEGTLVHHVLHGAPDGRRSMRSVQRYRRALGSAMQALKDHLELAVEVAAGRVP